MDERTILNELNNNIDIIMKFSNVIARGKRLPEEDRGPEFHQTMFRLQRQLDQTVYDTYLRIPSRYRKQDVALSGQYVLDLLNQWEDDLDAEEELEAQKHVFAKLKNRLLSNLFEKFSNN